MSEETQTITPPQPGMPGYMNWPSSPVPPPTYPPPPIRSAIPQPPPQHPMPAPTKAGGSGKWFFAVILALIAIIAWAGVYAWTHQPANEKTPDEYRTEGGLFVAQQMYDNSMAQSKTTQGLFSVQFGNSTGNITADCFVQGSAAQKDIVRQLHSYWDAGGK